MSIADSDGLTMRHFTALTTKGLPQIRSDDAHFSIADLGATIEGAGIAPKTALAYLLGSAAGLLTHPAIASGCTVLTLCHYGRR